MLVVLNVLAAVLPAWGLIRLLVRATRQLREIRALTAERGYGHVSYDDVKEFFGPDLQHRTRGEVRELWIDLALVGGGLALGAVANIWSLLASAPAVP